MFLFSAMKSSIAVKKSCSSHITREGVIFFSRQFGVLIQTNIKWQSGEKVILDGLWKRGLMLQTLTIGTGKIFCKSLCFFFFPLCLIKGRI
jgi:hypothetical protein